MGITVGIDLGTTYSAVAVLRPTGEPEVLINNAGEEITPSVVMFQDIGGRDEPLVGTMAKHAAAGAPDDVVEFVKRFMGDRAYRFESSSGSAYTAEEISAIILRRLKEDAEFTLGAEVTRAVITVPAYFDDARRKATKDAGEIAGLTVLRVLNEPTAAALSFGLDTSAQGNVLVYDLGGGTFDVTVMRINAGEFEVLGTDGDRNLGGKDFDDRIMMFAAQSVQAQGGVDLLDDSLLTASLREKAEMAKRSLTTVPTTMMLVPAGGQTHRIRLDRAEFERITSDLLNRTEDLTTSVLEEAGLRWSDIDHVLLVGGSTRMPMVREMVERLAGQPVNKSVHPDHAVALGAAIQAAVEDASDVGTTVDLYQGKPLVVQDVTSQALGTAAINPDTGKLENAIIVPRNTRIPVKCQQTFFTTVHEQKIVNVDCNEGDDIDLQYVVKLGEKDIPIPPYPKGSPITVSFAYDIDQTVFVEVFDDTSGKRLGTFEIDRVANMSGADIEEAKTRISQIAVS
ncbi:Hsp70 family protein [Smaragdicoccus niigatensis]|uniref:Hsp70 family protein n=1 Tax=Smaragdicoccus niigatensis TaxID=359359 RepID=UPI000368FF04|nr:Hsp70 family protein [Smaragdicoccus niigatensis]